MKLSTDVSNATAADGTAYDLLGPDNAPIVVLIHGLGLCRQLWHPHIEQLSKTYRVLNYDLYGHGQSPAPPETASLTVFSNQLKNLLDQLQIKQVSIIGFSIGGMINRRFALDHGNRLNTLVILNSPHNRGELAQQQVEARAAKVSETGVMATLDDALRRWFTPDFLTRHQQSVNAVRQWREIVDPASYAQAAWVLANGVRELIAPVPPITQPTLIMTSENDSGSTPAMSKAIAAEIKNARLTIIPQLQHLGLMEQPNAFIEPILHFLNEHTT